MKLEIVCSWCGAKIGEKECDVFNESLPRITHSICKKCRTKVLDDLKQSDESQRKDAIPLINERRN